MNILFGNKKKDPTALVRGLKEILVTLDKAAPKSSEKISEEISKQLSQMKFILYGDPENEPNPELGTQLANEIYSTDLLPLLIQHMSKLEFEAKKDVTAIFNNLVRRTVGNRQPTVEYLCKNTNILHSLIQGYESADIAPHCGSILRECARHESLAKLIISAPNFNSFYTYIEDVNFDVASDGFSTFKELITKHKTLSAEFLEKNYDSVFENYTKLLNSENYVVRRQSLKLLGELLLDRANFNIMTRYISDQENLKLMMNLLRDKSKSIQFEAFHVFKVFVANPNKTPAILNILIKNKSKLVSFLGNFHNDNEEDQFNDEKAFLLKQIQQLPDKKVE
jgi:calcium binding protein 39